jgi:hypothetical protein
MKRLTLLVALLSAAGTARGEAQSAWHVAAGLSGAHEIVDSKSTGTVFGGEALVSGGNVQARLRYGQGSIAGDSVSRDVVMGEALLGYRVRSWLSAWIGPEARTFTAPGLSDRRWLLWSARVSARGAIFPGRLDSFAELWEGFSGTLSRPAADARGGGAELGLEAPLARAFWARLGYRIEQGRVSGGAKETVEGFALTLGWSLR